jgi:hypothetical protein
MRRFMVGLARVALVVSGSIPAWADTGVTEEWRINTTDAVRRCTTRTDFTLPARTTGHNATSYSDTAVVAGTTYRYRVRAAGFMGSSAYAGPIEIVVGGIPASGGLGVPVPGAGCQRWGRVRAVGGRLRHRHPLTTERSRAHHHARWWPSIFGELCPQPR